MDSGGFAVLEASAISRGILALIILFFGYTFILYPFCICPTRHLPGKYISKVTGFWELQLLLRNQNIFNDYNLHLQYGPVVRISPSTVSVCTTEALPVLFGARSAFPKPSSVALFQNHGRPNTFSSQSKEEHKRRRSRYSNLYSKSNLTRSDAYHSVVTRTVDVLNIFKRAAATGQSVDIFQAFHLYALDNVSAIAYGSSVGTMAGRNRTIPQALHNLISGLSPVVALPILENISRLPVVGHLVLSGKVLRTLESFGPIESTSLKQFEQSKDMNDPEVKSSVLAHLKQHKDFGTDDLGDLDIASELSDHFFAGGDTTTAAITYLIYQLALPQNESHLHRLISELNSIHFDESGMPTSFNDLDKCPWLDCCIRESLRIHPPPGTRIVRQVPATGATIAGLHIPGDVQVGIAPYSLHRDETIYEDPDSFNPERWLDSDEQKLNKMKLAWIPFGHGARICVGQYLAMIEIKLMTAAICHQLTPRIDGSYDPKDMEALQLVVIVPKGGVCYAKFTTHSE